MELLVAMLLLVLVSAMLYSVLNTGIGFASKGEARLARIERDRSLLELINRQIQGAWYDVLLKKVRLSVNDNYLQMVTTAPLLNRDAGVVLAVYFYDSATDTLYYTEKKDFYNPDYEKDYQPDRTEMEVLLKGVGGISWAFDNDQGMLQLTYGGMEYSLAVRCWQPETL